MFTPKEDIFKSMQKLHIKVNTVRDLDKFVSMHSRQQALIKLG